MHSCHVRRYQELDGSVPFDEWLMLLGARGKQQNLDAVAGIARAIHRLGQLGFETRRPTSAPLRDGMHELRVRSGTVNLRVLYFFHGPGVAIIAHGCTKESQVDEADIARAIDRRNKYVQSPVLHTAPSP